MKIAIGNDHSGIQMKNAILRHLQRLGHEVINLGVDEDKSVDYPDYGKAVGQVVINDHLDFGIVICGTGIGISIAANKVPGIRAALVHDVTTARLAKNHNNANVLALGARILAIPLALDLVDEFMKAKFEKRHQKRLDKISVMEHGLK